MSLNQFSWCRLYSKAQYQNSKLQSCLHRLFCDCIRFYMFFLLHWVLCGELFRFCSPAWIQSMKYVYIYMKIVNLNLINLTFSFYYNAIEKLDTAGPTNCCWNIISISLVVLWIDNVGIVFHHILRRLVIIAWHICYASFRYWWINPKNQNDGYER